MRRVKISAQRLHTSAFIYFLWIQLHQFLGVALNLQSSSPTWSYPWGCHRVSLTFQPQAFTQLFDAKLNVTLVESPFNAPSVQAHVRIEIICKLTMELINRKWVLMTNLIMASLYDQTYLLPASQMSAPLFFFSCLLDWISNLTTPLCSLVRSIRH